MRNVRTSILSPRWHASNGEHTVSLGVWNHGKTFEARNFLHYSKESNDSGFVLVEAQCHALLSMFLLEKLEKLVVMKVSLVKQP